MSNSKQHQTKKEPSSLSEKNFQKEYSNKKSKTSKTIAIIDDPENEQIKTAAEIANEKVKDYDKIIDNPENKPVEAHDHRFVLLPNWKHNCNICHGTGKEGQQPTGNKEFIPCHKCSKNAYAFLNIINGTLHHDKHFGIY